MVVVTGDTDAVVAPWIHADGLVRDIPGAEKVTIPGAGHMPHHSHPDAVVQAITGASVLIGRIGFGYLLDRFQASTVALVSVVMAALVYVSYASGGTFETIVLTAMAAGTAVVAVIAAGAWITSRRPTAAPVVPAASGTLEISTNPSARPEASE